VVHSSTRPDGDLAGDRLLDQPRRRTRRRSQPPAPTAPRVDEIDAGGRRVAGGFVPHRRPTGCGRTDVRSASCGVAHDHEASDDGTLGSGPLGAGGLDEHGVGAAPGRLQRAMLRAVRWYQLGAEGRPSPCRFFPSCSEYAVEAIEIHGAARGLVLTLRRLSRCRPFGPSGFDPVPEPRSSSTSAGEALPPPQKA
jgi:uncharacterized protein